MTDDSSKDGYVEHSYSDDSDATCDCGYTRTIEHTHEWGSYISDGEYLMDCHDTDENGYCDDCGTEYHKHVYAPATCAAPMTCQEIKD